jgi:hypothetical protein
MNVDTRLTGTWRNRMLFVVVMILGFSAWFFYDGMVTWPAEAERYEEWLSVARAELGRDLEEGSIPPEAKLAWERHAKEKGWSSKIPKERTEEDIAGQFKWGTGVGLVGLGFLAWVLWNQTLHIRADDQFVYSARGKKVPWEAFTGMDRAKWEKKGIAVALYEENGAEKRLVLDDYKFGGTEPIIVEIERRLGIEYVPPKDEEEDEDVEDAEKDGADADDDVPEKER